MENGCFNADSVVVSPGCKARMFSLLVNMQQLSSGYCSKITLEDPVSGYNSANDQDCQVRRLAC